MTSYNSTSCAHAQLKQLGTCQWHNYQTVPRAFEAEGAVVSSSSVERGGGEVGGEEWKERRKRGTCGGSRLRRWSLEKRPCSARMKGLNATQRSGSGLRIPPLSLPSYFSFLFFPFLLSLLPASSRGSALFSAGVNGLKSGGWSSGPDQDHGGCVPSESRMGGTGQWKFVLFLVSVFH